MGKFLFVVFLMVVSFAAGSCLVIEGMAEGMRQGKVIILK